MLLYHKPEAVAPSYTPGTLGNLLVKYNTVRQFLGGPPTKNGARANICGQTTPTGSIYAKGRHFCGVIGNKKCQQRSWWRQVTARVLWESCS